MVLESQQYLILETATTMQLLVCRVLRKTLGWKEINTKLVFPSFSFPIS